VWLFVAATTGLFLAASWKLNPLALALTPVALAVIWGYSYTKRFTRYCHLVLGLAIGIAPAGAWIAVRGTLDWVPVLLSLAVMLWVGGFDIIYACQDTEFDRQVGLHSLPSRLGIAAALRLSRAMHVLTVLLLAALPALLPLGAVYIAGVVIAALLLGYEHTLVRADDLSKVNAAFFTMNGFVSIGLFLFTAADVLLPR
jgi:4-hydroxybenzoate polyprenyltransferase